MSHVHVSQCHRVQVANTLWLVDDDDFCRWLCQLGQELFVSDEPTSDQWVLDRVDQMLVRLGQKVLDRVGKAIGKNHQMRWPPVHFSTKKDLCCGTTP